MTESVSSILAVRASAPTGLSRLISWSFATHLLLAGFVLVWQAWFSRTSDDSVMMISLSGSSDTATTGLTPIGGKQVDQVAPEPRRPEPTPVATAPKSEMTIPTKSTATKPPAKTETAAQTSSVVKPATGSHVASGSSVIDTGARGESSGLSQTVGAGAEVDPEFKFCCDAYLGAMKVAIQSNINFNVGPHGVVVIKFEVARDGTIARNSIRVEKSSNIQTLDTEAQYGVRITKLPPLPAEYKPNTLIVTLNVRF
jgi:TonB family protein